MDSQINMSPGQKFLVYLAWGLSFGAYGFGLLLGILIPFTIGMSGLFIPIPILLLAVGFLLSNKIRLNPSLPPHLKAKAEAAYKISRSSLKAIGWAMVAFIGVVVFALMISIIMKLFLHK